MFRALYIVCVFVFLFLCTALASADPSAMESLSVSPDGKFIAVSYGNEHARFIYKISVERGIAVRLTRASKGWESNPTFSADGRQIAYSYVAATGENSRIIIANSDGSDFHVWQSPGGSDFRPLFSPDGKTMILAHSGFYGSYSWLAQPHSHDWSFYAANLDGTNVRRITNGSFYMASAASVSANGKDLMLITEGFESPRQIAIYSLDHPGEPNRTLQPHVPHEPGEPILDWPNYMPDGESILFLAARDGIFHYDYDVYRLILRTSTIEKLTTKNGYATDLRIFPDGKSAVFLRWRSNWRSTPIKNSLFFLDLASHKVTAFRVTGLN